MLLSNQNALTPSPKEEDGMMTEPVADKR